MPGPFGRPRLTVSPDVSEWTRTPLSRRPTSTAMSACPASWQIVTRVRTTGHAKTTAANAATASSSDPQGLGSGWVASAQRQSSANRCTCPS